MIHANVATSGTPFPFPPPDGNLPAFRAVEGEEILFVPPAVAQQKMEKAIAILAQLPPFPPTLGRVVATFAQEDVSFARLAVFIEKDAALAGNLLSLVNSALFGLRGKVDSIRHAITMLGMTRLRKALLSFLAMAFWKQFKVPCCYSIRDFNLNGVAVGLLSDSIAHQLSLEHADSVFVAGLFHDLGRMLIAMALPEDTARLKQLYQESACTPEECERAVLGFTLAELTSRALEEWNVSSHVRTAVEFQDAPDLDRSETDPSKVTLSRVLNIARHYVRSKQIGPCTEPVGKPAGTIDSLGLGPRFESRLVDFEEEFAAIQRYY